MQNLKQTMKHGWNLNNQRKKDGIEEEDNGIQAGIMSMWLWCDEQTGANEMVKKVDIGYLAQKPRAVIKFASWEELIVVGCA